MIYISLLFFLVINDGALHLRINDKNGLKSSIGDSNQLETVSSFESTRPLVQTTAVKTELASLLDGFSLKNPTSVNAVILWHCTAKHPTDLDARKGERVKILYRNGDLAFVENSDKKQGFVPLCYCSLYRRSSSTLSDLSADTSRKLSTNENIEQTISESTEKPLERNRSNSVTKEMNSNPVRTKVLGNMISRGSYDTRKAESRSKKKSDKGIFNNAAKKLAKVFTSSFTSKQKTKTSKNQPEKRPIPDWLLQLEFDNNNTDYSSSSDSSDDDDDSAYESFRLGSETFAPVIRRHRSNTAGAPMRNSLMSTPDDFFMNRGEIDRIKIQQRTGEESSQDITTGYANVRKLRTSSRLTGNGVTRSQSFNLDSRTRTLHRARHRRPKDLLDGRNAEIDIHINDIVNGTSLKRVHSNGCIKYDNIENDFCETTVIVRHDFISANNKDLHVLRGQRLQVLNRNDDDWWLCEAENGRAGFVPSECLAYDNRMRFSGNFDYLADDYQQNGRNHWQDASSKAKAASVKLARITPMAREPNSIQHDEVTTSLKQDGHTGWGKREIRDQEWTVEVKSLQPEPYSDECCKEDCLECVAACSACEKERLGKKTIAARPIDHEKLYTCRTRQKEPCSANDDRLVDERAHLNGLFNSENSQMEHVESCKDCCEGVGHTVKTDIKGREQSDLTRKSETGEELQLDAARADKSCDVVEADPVCTIEEKRDLQPVLPGVSKTGDEQFTGEKSHTTPAGDEISQLLPSYDQIMEQRHLDGLSEMKNRLSLKINNLHERIEQTKINGHGIVEKLLDEWRLEQKKAVDKLPMLERRTSSDSQSTVSDAIDTAPRVLKRRNSANRRVRFQTPDNTKVNESQSDSGTGNNENGIHREHILATWL